MKRGVFGTSTDTLIIRGSWGYGEACYYYSVGGSVWVSSWNGWEELDCEIMVVIAV